MRLGTRSQCDRKGQLTFGQKVIDTKLDARANTCLFLLSSNCLTILRRENAGRGIGRNHRTDRQLPLFSEQQRTNCVLSINPYMIGIQSAPHRSVSASGFISRTARRERRSQARGFTIFGRAIASEEGNTYDFA